MFVEYNCLNVMNKPITDENERNINKKITPDYENWNLTLGLIVILENVSKMKEVGRVLPWVFFKNTIYHVYQEYYNHLNELHFYPNSKVSPQLIVHFAWRVPHPLYASKILAKKSGWTKNTRISSFAEVLPEQADESPKLCSAVEYFWNRLVNLYETELINKTRTSKTS